MPFQLEQSNPIIAMFSDDENKQFYVATLSNEEVGIYLKSEANEEGVWLNFLQNAPGINSLAHNALFLPWIKEYFINHALPDDANEIYQFLFQQWFVYQKERLSKAGLLNDYKGDFIEHCWVYTHAVALRLNSTDMDSIDFNGDAFSEGPGLEQWERFFSPVMPTTLVRQGCPWCIVDNEQLSLYHPDIVKYFAGLTTYDLKNYLYLPFIQGDEGLEPLCELLDRDVLQANSGQSNHFVSGVLVGDVSKDDYFRLVYLSAKDKKFARIAANAITILNYARVSFSGMDLSGIRILGANLSRAMMDSANLQESNLSHVLFAGAFLRNANLDGSNLLKVNFMQRPSLPGHGQISAAAYNSSLQWLFCATEISVDVFGVQVVSLHSNDAGNVISYAARNTLWKKYQIQDIALSHSGKLLAGFNFNHEMYKRQSEVYIYQLRCEQPNIFNIEKCIFNTLIDIDELKCITISPNDKWAAVGGFDQVAVINLNTKTTTIISLRKELFVNAIAFSHSGNLLAAVTEFHGPALFIYDTKDFKIRREIDFSEKIENGADLVDVQFSHDDNWIAIGTTQEAILLINRHSWDERLIKFRGGECGNICFSPDDRYLFFSSKDWDGKLKIYQYSLESFSIEKTYIISSTAESANIYCVQETKNAYRIIIADKSGNIHQINFNEMPLITDDEREVALFCLIYETTIIATIFNDSNKQTFLALRDLATKRTLKKMPIDISAHCIAAHPTRPLLAVGGSSAKSSREFLSEQSFEAFQSDLTGTIQLFDLYQYKIVTINLQRPKFVIDAVAFSQDGSYLTYGGKDGQVFIYQLLFEENRLRDVELVNKISLKGEPIWTLQFSSHSNYLAIGAGKTLYIYRIKDQRRIFSDEFRDGIISIEFAPNDAFFVINSSSKGADTFSLYWIDNSTIRPGAIFKGHQEVVKCVAIAPQNEFIVSSGNDGKLIFWEVPELQKNNQINETTILYEFSGYFESCEYLSFDKQGHLIVLSNSNLTRWKVVYNPMSDEKILTILQWISGESSFYGRGLSYDGVKNISENNRILLSQSGGKNLQDKEKLFKKLRPFPLWTDSPIMAPENFHEKLLKAIRKVVGDRSNLKPFLEAIEEKAYSKALRRVCTAEKEDKIIIESVKMLLTFKEDLHININEQAGELQRAAIHYATSKNNQTLIDLLVMHGADLDLPDRNGKTARENLPSFKAFK